MAMQPALDYITVKGFRSIAALEKFPLGRINVLIGANGSGKSNLLAVFSFLRQITEGRLQEYVRINGGADQLLHFGSKTTQQIEIHLSFVNEVNQHQYRLVLKPTTDDSLYPAEEKAYFWDRHRDSIPQCELITPLSPVANGREAAVSDPQISRISQISGWIRTRLEHLRVYHAHDTSATSPMRKTARLHDNAFLRPDAANLPAFLYRLLQKHSDSYALIRSAVKRIAPFFDDFILRPDPLNEETIRLEWKHMNSDQYFDASALSDGSLRFIVLATLLLQPDRFLPSVILIDEPDLGLHPYAITLLSSLAKHVAAKTQVILATQSSLLLDHFEPEDVIIAERSRGATQLRHLDPAGLESWLEDYSLGQLWEKNEFGARPSPE
jgi:predicted ATPase